MPKGVSRQQNDFIRWIGFNKHDPTMSLECHYPFRHVRKYKVCYVCDTVKYHTEYKNPCSVYMDCSENNICDTCYITYFDSGKKSCIKCSSRFAPHIIKTMYPKYIPKKYIKSRLPLEFKEFGYKQCPKCFTFTEKNGGCGQMTCTVCKCTWDWFHNFIYTWDTLDILGIVWNHLESFGTTWNRLEPLGIP